MLIVIHIRSIKEMWQTIDLSFNDVLLAKFFKANAKGLFISSQVRPHLLLAMLTWILHLNRWAFHRYDYQKRGKGNLTYIFFFLIKRQHIVKTKMPCIYQSFGTIHLRPIARQAPLSMEFSQARILEWVAIPFSKESSWARDQTWVSYIAGRLFLPSQPPGKPSN